MKSWTCGGTCREKLHRELTISRKRADLACMCVCVCSPLKITGVTLLFRARRVCRSRFGQATHVRTRPAQEMKTINSRCPDRAIVARILGRSRGFVKIGSAAGKLEAFSRNEACFHRLEEHLARISDLCPDSACEASSRTTLTGSYGHLTRKIS